jgi:hypothetical protein
MPISNDAKGQEFEPAEIELMEGLENSEMKRGSTYSSKKTVVSRWMEEHHGQMISCPHQPGLLLISKKACLKRYRAAVARVFDNISEENVFHYTLKKGLTTCEGCPIGRKLDGEQRALSTRKGRSEPEPSE